ncbi:hypothetical protein AJ79_00214 [Helicocarpus griseus UAMH5409]|uniref:DUF4396 domain-containing protein n=1 Tax=Helicocarpus griseus UAMH5409 TaxID=1447875 RepID=A0A2B7YCL3_9EURO|nr:hypothetical protein AJ79_00214 [Helicocarpus griseus UAMH5409]
MASCCDSDDKRKASSDSKPVPNPSGSSRLSSIITPVASALLHSSCCWLPALLDFFTIGSASASQFQSLRPFFFWATILILVESVRRNGFDRRAFFRIAISGFFLALPQLYICTGLPRGSIMGGGQFRTRCMPWTRRLCHIQPTCTHPRALFGVAKLSAQPKRKYHDAKPKTPTSPLTLDFWASRPNWRRALLNTMRCLIGCTLGDFTSMWFLQAYYPDLGVGAIMSVSMATGIGSSMTLETVLLRLGRDKLGWVEAVRTAAGMSMISMLSMEAVQNMVDYHLTGGVVTLSDPYFWTAAGISMAAGFLAPLPYNYVRLRRYGKACH